MKRGLPRPLVYIEKLENLGWDDDAKWRNRRYPIPYTAGGYISLISDGRAKECVSFRKCFVCGEHVPGKPWALAKGEDLSTEHGEAGPYHEVCIKIAMRMCPHIAEGEYSAVQIDYPELESDTKDYW